MNARTIARADAGARRAAAPRLRRRDADRLTERLKALAHPVRLRMLELIGLRGGQLCVCEFEGHFDLTQPTISHHLKVLRDAGLIRSRQDGRWVFHHLEPDAFRELARVFGGWAGGPAA